MLLLSYSALNTSGHTSGISEREDNDKKSLSVAINRSAYSNSLFGYNLSTGSEPADSLVDLVDIVGNYYTETILSYNNKVLKYVNKFLDKLSYELYGDKIIRRKDVVLTNNGINYYYGYNLLVSALHKIVDKTQFVRDFKNRLEKDVKKTNTSIKDSLEAMKKSLSHSYKSTSRELEAEVTRLKKEGLLYINRNLKKNLNEQKMEYFKLTGKTIPKNKKASNELVLFKEGKKIGLSMKENMWSNQIYSIISSATLEFIRPIKCFVSGLSSKLDKDVFSELAFPNHTDYVNTTNLLSIVNKQKEEIDQFIEKLNLKLDQKIIPSAHDQIPKLLKQMENKLSQIYISKLEELEKEIYENEHLRTKNQELQKQLDNHKEMIKLEKTKVISNEQDNKEQQQQKIFQEFEAKVNQTLSTFSSSITNMQSQQHSKEDKKSEKKEKKNLKKLKKQIESHKEKEERTNKILNNMCDLLQGEVIIGPRELSQIRTSIAQPYPLGYNAIDSIINTINLNHTTTSTSSIETEKQNDIIIGSLYTQGKALEKLIERLNPNVADDIEEEIDKETTLTASPVTITTQQPQENKKVSYRKKSNKRQRRNNK